MRNTPVVTNPSRGRHIIIGSAYVPPKSPRYADPVEHHVTRRGHTAVWLVGAVVLGLLAAGWLR